MLLELFFGDRRRAHGTYIAYQVAFNDSGSIICEMTSWSNLWSCIFSARSHSMTPSQLITIAVCQARVAGGWYTKKKNTHTHNNINLNVNCNWLRLRDEYYHPHTHIEIDRVNDRFSMHWHKWKFIYISRSVGDRALSRRISQSKLVWRDDVCVITVITFYWESSSFRNASYSWVAILNACPSWRRYTIPTRTCPAFRCLFFWR